MTQLFSNNAGTTIVGSLTTASTAITVATGTGARFNSPTGGDFELLTLHDRLYSKWEVVKVTARSGDVLTVTRQHEGTLQTWADGEFISANITKATMDLLISNTDDKLASVVAGDNITVDNTDPQNPVVASTASGGGGASASPMTSITMDIDTVLTNGGGTDEFHHYTIQSTTDNLADHNVGLNHAMPGLPVMGFTRQEWASTQIFVNGEYVPQFFDRFFNDSSPDAGTVAILGPRHLRFGTALTLTDVITVVAPRGDWFEDGVTTGYMDMYKETGVENSYAGGGYGSSYTATVQEFSWDTYFTTTLATGYNLYASDEGGSGATSNNDGKLFFFGSGVTEYAVSSRISVMTIDVSTVETSSNFNIGTGWGSAFTDESDSWIVGYGWTQSDSAIRKFDMVLETNAAVTATIDGNTCDGMQSFCDGTIGWSFNYKDSSNSSSTGMYQKLTCATDAISTEAAIGTTKPLYNGFAAVMFRNGSAYLWSEYDTSGIYKFDLTTETVTNTFTYNRNYPYTNDGRQVMCDGENQAQSMTGALLANAVEAIAINRNRQATGTNTWTARVRRPCGCATDYYTAC